MIAKHSKRLLVSGFLVLSLVTMSFSNIFIARSYAAAADAAVSDNTDSNNANDKGLLAGIAAIGLISVLSHHGGSSDSSAAPGKTTGSTGSTTGSGQTQSGGNYAALEQQAFTLLNQDRAANGLPALKFNSSLTAVAENFAQDMINRGYFSHYTPEGLSPFNRMSQAGISYKSAGENIAEDTSVQSAETAFMNSSGHRANILNTSYTDVGIGIRQSANGTLYIVQDFISR
jgi:uncharacterized protein YkwD